jgi:hypothetical protein
MAQSAFPRFRGMRLIDSDSLALLVPKVPSYLSSGA